MFKASRLQLIRLLAAIMLASIAGYAQNTTEQVVKKCSDAVVLIFVSDSGKETGLGSGFIISADGKIVTNYHVIKNADKALVKLTNGAFFPVESVLVSDPVEDLAIIKVAGRNLPVLQVVDSDSVQVGERVVAIGSPLGLESTVSDGIVSALRKEESGSWIQTTAPVSPGNSGGPLLRLDGTVIGIITWGIKGGQNLNFAAASNELKTLADKPANAKPLTADKPNDKSSPNVASGLIWTSLASGKDYKVRFDGDYIYTEWTNIPGSGAWVAATFGKGELKKQGAIWTGHSRQHFPCQYYNKINWITVDLEMEITSMTPTRIEGRARNYAQGFNCRTTKPKGEPTWTTFTWIPKE